MFHFKTQYLAINGVKSTSNLELSDNHKQNVCIIISNTSCYKKMTFFYNNLSDFTLSVIMKHSQP